jgi:hypothetical protein
MRLALWFTGLVLMLLSGALGAYSIMRKSERLLAVASGLAVVALVLLMVVRCLTDLE